MKIYSPQIIGDTSLTGALDVTGGITSSTLYSLSGSFLNLSAVSASFGHVTTVTGSAVIIGDEFIILNADTPAARYAGLIVYDSGSGSPATASFEWDGLTDNWIIQEETGNTAVVLTGPTGSRGAEILPTVNVLQKGGGHHQLIDSNITDDGTTVSISTPLVVTGSINASSFTGSLDGTASFAVSASFAPSTPAFPFTGSAIITGSLTIFGNESISGSLLINDNPNSNVAGINIGVIGQTANTVPGNSSQPGMVVGYSNVGNFNRSYVFGRANTLNFLANGGENIVIGVSNTITGNATTRNILLGESNAISGDGRSNVLVGESHQTTTGPDYGGAFAGFNNTISHDRSVVIGGQNITTAADDTVYVPNFNASGSAVVTGSLTINTPVDGVAFDLRQGNNSAYNISQGGGFDTATTILLNATHNFTGGSNSSYRFSRPLTVNSTLVVTGSATVQGGLTVTGSINVLSGSFSGSAINNITDVYTSTAAIEHVISLTQAEYNTISGSADPNTLYYITDASSTVVSASYAESASFAVSSSFATTASFYSLASVDQDVVITGSLRGNVSILSVSSNTASLDLSTGNFYTLSLDSGSNTFVNPSNILPGQTINLRIIQPDLGFGTVSFPSSVKQVSGSAYVPTAEAFAQDIVTFISFDSTSLYLSNVKNLV